MERRVTQPHAGSFLTFNALPDQRTAMNTRRQPVGDHLGSPFMHLAGIAWNPQEIVRSYAV